MSAIYILFIATILAVYISASTSRTTLAYETTCPPEMSDQDCLDYLQEQANQISSEKNEVSDKISNEEYAQLDLYGKMNYVTSQISETEKVIEKLEVQLAQNIVEIRLLNKDIDHAQTNIDTASQEITRLQESIRKRIAISYKYSSISSLEVFLDIDETQELLRNLKYIKDTREKDRELLAGMSEQIQALEIEQNILTEKKYEVQVKQEDAEKKKTELFEEKVTLDEQKGEFNSLLAESQYREAQYLAKYEELEAAQDEATAQITQLIFQLFESGTITANTPVDAGDILGFQGNTGFTTGSHLHFEYRRNGYVANPNTFNCLSVAYGIFAGGIDCVVPVDGGYVSQFPHYYNSAVDLVSYTSGEQPGRYITMPAISCYGLYLPERYYYTRGTGAPVRAIKSGKVTKVQVDACGGKYVIVDHGGGETSLYLHLN